MLRWLHDRLRTHKWENVTHLHEVEQDGEKFDYDLNECRCGALREFVIVKTELASPFPGITAGFLEITVNDLDRLEDAKVWAKP